MNDYNGSLFEQLKNITFFSFMIWNYHYIFIQPSNRLVPTDIFLARNINFIHLQFKKNVRIGHFMLRLITFLLQIIGHHTNYKE